MFEQTPLFQALIAHSQKNPISMHVPGHKNGSLLNEAGWDYFKRISELDVTELTGLDDLHDAESCIKEAQDLTARLYGADRSYFLVGGSTAGNLAMILAAFRRGDHVMVQRNCHKSVLNGLELAGIRPVFLGPEIHEKGGFALGITLSTVERAMEQYPDVKGLIVTSPNYYGMSRDLTDVVAYMHHHQLPVIADEAHGAHYAADGFPLSVLAMGADAVVQSAHKTLPAMTMGAYLHVGKGSLLQQRKIEHALQSIQSSSPSYPIMASLDLSRSYLAQLDKSDIEEIIKQSNDLKQHLTQRGFLVIEPPIGYEADHLKITIQAKREYSGYEMQAAFENHGLYPELADSLNVLFVLPLGVSHETMRWKAAIDKAAAELNSREYRQKRNKYAPFPEVSSLFCSYDDMWSKETRKLELKQAEGRIAAEMVIPYPPGIPLMAKGERITKEMIDSFYKLQQNSARFQGSAGSEIGVFTEEGEQQ
ncbi:aminotransferase class I/II-fold pyridoxal phosphate-dependent enzyme [Fictibacillus iocasae]|uniref:Aminotransferase class I/II-fold pyridoxal phosphate-dependent enzyme n=1 Tax=Fictibacillus iocasae TaxID=2715437 RepID=A0ABW2NRZ5_9BACL